MAQPVPYLNAAQVINDHPAILVYTKHQNLNEQHSLCGLPITIRHPSGSSWKGILGGLIKVIDHDGVSCLYGLTSSAWFYPSPDEAAPIEDENVPALGPQLNDNLLLGRFAHVPGPWFPRNPSLATNNDDGSDYHHDHGPSPPPPAIATTTNRDWALISLTEAAAAVHNSLAVPPPPPQSSSSSSSPPSGSGRGNSFAGPWNGRSLLVLGAAAGQGGYRPAWCLAEEAARPVRARAGEDRDRAEILVVAGFGLRMSPPSVREVGSGTTPPPQTARQERRTSSSGGGALGRGDVGAWVVDRTTRELYGVLGDVDASGFGLVWPMNPVLDAIKANLGCRAVEMAEVKELLRAL